MSKLAAAVGRVRRTLSPDSRFRRTLSPDSRFRRTFSPDGRGRAAGPAPQPAADEKLLRDFVASEALKDVAAGMYDEHVATHGHPLLVENKIDWWHHQRSAETEKSQQDDLVVAGELVREATYQEAVATKSYELDERELERSERHLEHLHRVLDGQEPGHDGGRWAAPTDRYQSRRQATVSDWAVYVAAAAAEVGFNYAAFQLMGGSAWETAVYSAALVLIGVLLPKQLGVLLTELRSPHHRRQRLAALVGGAVLWVGASVFVAVIRTAFLLHPPPTGFEQDGLPAAPPLAQAGVGQALLTWGWIFVVLAVGVIVMARSASRHNPYLRGFPTLAARVATQRKAVVEQYGRLEAARLATVNARSREDVLTAKWAAERGRHDGLTGELKDHYRHHLARAKGAPPVTDSLEIGSGLVQRINPRRPKG